MTRFQVQQPSFRLISQPVDSDDKRETPFKQMVGLYNMWQALSPDTRQWLSDLFKSSKDEMMDVEVDTNPDEILDRDVETRRFTPTLDFADPYNIDWDAVKAGAEDSIKSKKPRVPDLTLSRNDWVGDEWDFATPPEARRISSDLPAGHYDNTWRGLF